MKQSVEFLIIGAGPTGLGAAYRLKDRGISDYLILERNQWVGGLAASFVDPEGFTWDIGGHVQFSHYPYFDRAMEVALSRDQWLHHQRESWVWIKQRFVPYPFQNNIRYLPREPMWRCLKGLVEVATSQALRLERGERPANFREWIRSSFGEGIAAEFMEPYNFKVWGYSPEEMSYQWIGERVATVELTRILENIIFEKSDASWGPNNSFRFPLNGGTGAIWNSLARHVGLHKIILGATVRRIDPNEHRVILDDGGSIEYEHLLSTMPLTTLSSIVSGLPSDVVQAAHRLRHSSSHIVGIGIRGTPHEELAKKCWMYFPEDTCPFYRMTMFSNYSPRNVPDATHQFSLMCEVSESPRKPVDRQRLIDDTIRGLVRNNLLGEDNEIVSRWSYTADYGYPTPSIERDDILSQVIPTLDNLGVFSRGRFGGWKYEVSNQDHSFMQGVEWTNRIIDSLPEQTFSQRPRA